MKLEEMLLNTRQQVEEVERSLALLMGKLPFPIKRISFDELHGYQYPASKGIPVSLLLHRPDVKAAELELFASKSDVKAARKAFFPLVFGRSRWFQRFRSGQVVCFSGFVGLQPGSRHHSPYLQAS